MTQRTRQIKIIHDRNLYKTYTTHLPIVIAMSTSESKDQKTENPTLGVLEEDDEFEEFPVAGRLAPFECTAMVLISGPQQTGTTHKQISPILRVQLQELLNQEETNYGRIIGTTMTSRTISVSSYGNTLSLFVASRNPNDFQTTGAS